MKIKYEFADGTVSEVEVEESIGAVIIEDRRLEDNLARKERYPWRSPCSKRASFQRMNIRKLIQSCLKNTGQLWVHY
ncbi:MAG: hypothetical protein K1W28_07405 [Lachnospiraceae bacterium]